MWNREQPSHQRKVDHLLAKSRRCQDNHPKCKELNKLAGEKIASWIAGQDHDNTKTSHPEHPSPPPTGESMTSPHPPRLTSIHKSKEIDLVDLSEEEDTLLQKIKSFSDKLKPENEVVTFGEVTLTDDERSLLNLGPGYMVLSDLDPEEMQVEATVTLTKIKWSRRSRGVDNMTDKAIAKEEEDVGLDKMLEQERLDELLNEEARDLIDPDWWLQHGTTESHRPT